MVELWMKFRESKKELVLPTVGHRFYVLKERHFKEYDDFQELELLVNKSILSPNLLSPAYCCLWGPSYPSTYTTVIA